MLLTFSLCNRVMLLFHHLFQCFLCKHGLFLNFIVLCELRHPPPPTTIITINSSTLKSVIISLNSLYGRVETKAVKVSCFSFFFNYGAWFEYQFRHCSPFFWHWQNNEILSFLATCMCCNFRSKKFKYLPFQNDYP